MIRKEPADHVFFNVQFSNREDEAIAIYQNKVIGIGSIPFIFSNYRGFTDYNAQGFFIANKDQSPIELMQSAIGIVIFKDTLREENKVWEIIEGACMGLHVDLLDPHWDDH